MSHPIILVHGVCRFDKIWSDELAIDNNDDPKLDKFHYFKGLRTMLMRHGLSVYHSNVSWAAGVSIRATELKDNIIQIIGDSGAEKVNIIAHSMGGLDTRHMMFDDRGSGRIHERIASITTISTPHAGSPFADWGTENLPHVIPIAQKLGLRLSGLKDMRTDCCQKFNNDPEVVAFENSCEAGIKIQTFAGRQAFWGVFDALKLPYYIIEKKEGDNDGLVSVQSAKWRDHYFKGVLDETDHLNELAWWDTAQILEGETENQLIDRIHAFYLNIARELP